MVPERAPAYACRLRLARCKVARLLLGDPVKLVMRRVRHMGHIIAQTSDTASDGLVPRAPDRPAKRAAFVTRRLALNPMLNGSRVAACVRNTTRLGVSPMHPSSPQRSEEGICVFGDQPSLDRQAACVLPKSQPVGPELLDAVNKVWTHPPFV